MLFPPPLNPSKKMTSPQKKQCLNAVDFFLRDSQRCPKVKSEVEKIPPEKILHKMFVPSKATGDSHPPIAWWIVNLTPSMEFAIVMNLEEQNREEEALPFS